MYTEINVYVYKLYINKIIPCKDLREIKEIKFIFHIKKEGNKT